MDLVEMLSKIQLRHVARQHTILQHLGLWVLLLPEVRIRVGQVVLLRENPRLMTRDLSDDVTTSSHSLALKSNNRG